MFRGTVAGADSLTFKAGRKKWDEFHRSRHNPWRDGLGSLPHQSGNQSRKPVP